MINFIEIEKNISQLTQAFKSAAPFSYIVIDNFAQEDRLLKILDTFPLPGADNLNKSRDYIFAKNKYEKANFKAVSPECQEIYQDFVSERFQKIISQITNQDVFIDREFHGGGIHQGGEGSFLDMHVDFNYHPLHHNWFRNLNILLYLNPGWKPEYGGQLKLKHTQTGEHTEIEPLFNRCVIMHTRDYTLHGYDPISFPQGKFRRSIATYAYNIDPNPQNQRSTLWIPETASPLKKILGQYWPDLVKVKSAVFGSATAKNK
ncbi:MAG: 2OG-Fe(II) oxygenase [Cyanobacteria bacterium J06621_12]